MCFETIFKNMEAMFPNLMSSLKVGWTHFHTTPPIDPKWVFGCGGFFEACNYS
jgi:hypothetical protein